MSARTSMILALVASFLFGATAGAIGAFVTVHAVAEHHHGGPPKFGHGPRPMMGRLGSRLELTPDQKQRFNQILDRSHGRMSALRESTQVELEQVLTPAQRERWQQMEHRMLRFRPPDGAPEAGPPDDGGPEGGPHGDPH